MTRQIFGWTFMALAAGIWGVALARAAALRADRYGERPFLANPFVGASPSEVLSRTTYAPGHEKVAVRLRWLLLLVSCLGMVGFGLLVAAPK